MIVELLQYGIRAQQVNEDYGLNVSMIGRWRQEYISKSGYFTKKERDAFTGTET